MFGRVLNRKNFITVLLIGFCIYIVKLYFQDNIILYIHPRYTIFTVVMCTIAIPILIGGLAYNIFKKELVKINKSKFIRPLDGLALATLALAFVLPAQALSSQAIQRRSLNTPDSANQSSVSTDCPDAKPDSIEAWVTEIGLYSINCYKGETIELTGFVFESNENPLPGDMFYLGRMVMSCCAVDTRPYALPIQKAGFESYPKDTWLRVEGKLEPANVNGSIQLVVKPKGVTKIDNPSKPYDYLNIPSTPTVEPLQQVE